MTSGDNMMKYKDLIEEYTKKPTEQQITDFVEYVSNAHSWYKHILGIGNSTEFYLYINPVAGYARIRDRETKELKFQVKQKGDRFFHYNEMATEDYHSRFGHLTFSCNEGTRIFYNTKDGVSDAKLSQPVLHLPDGSNVEMPESISTKARCFLNSCISEYMSSHWLLRTHRAAPDDLKKEFGKEHKTLHLFLSKLGETGANFITENNSSEQDRDLVQHYLSEEKLKQKKRMKKALEEIIELSYN